MTIITHIVTSSKLMRCMAFTNEIDARVKAHEWEAAAPVGRQDAESPTTVYTWREWVDLAEQNECKPLDGIENISVIETNF